MTQKQLSHKLRKIALALIDAQDDIDAIMNANEQDLSHVTGLLSQIEVEELNQLTCDLNQALSTLAHFEQLEDLLDIDGSVK